ncbi:MAG: hypothetical protein IPJ65_08520 [Archangiaceae bacterium]|nr:hypothetical protein [Archangiaceae bacterium]
MVKRLEALVPKRRLDAMMEEVDGRALVSSLPAEDVYGTIVDVGLNDSTEVVQLATPEQFRTFVDLAAWSRDRMDPIEVLHWLRAGRGDDEEEYLHKLKALDIEIVELLFKKLVTLYDLEEDPDANPEGITIETPEGKWLVELSLDGADGVALRQLTMDLMAQSPFELSRFLEAVRWETTAELEETAYQFRSARLADLGFPPMEEAVKLFAWVDPAKYAPAKAAPALATQESFVAAAFAGLDAHERNVLEAQVRYLVNSALVAEGAEPGDPPSIRRLSEQARDYLNLGLEHLCGGDPRSAAEVLRERPLKLVFQIGFSLTLQLKRQVERLASEPGSKFAETWLTLDDEAAALQALTRRRPLKALKVPGAEPVPFRWRRELGESEALLQKVRAQRDVFGKLLGASPAEVVARFGVKKFSELGAQRLFAAAAAWAYATGAVKVEPFDRSQLDALLEPGGKASGLLPDAMVERVLAPVRAELTELKRRDGAIEPEKITLLPIAGQSLL